MRQFLLAAFAFLAPLPAFAQKDRVLKARLTQKDRKKLTFRSNGRRPYVIVIAQVADLRDERYVLGTITRGHDLRVEKTEADRYQVWWQGKGVWIDRADVLPSNEAIDYFTEAIRQQPTAVDFIVRGGLRMGTDPDGALDDFNKAIDLDQSQASFYDYRGFTWMVKGDFDKALADFDEAMRLDPTNAMPHDKRGLALRDMGEFDKALAAFDEAIRLDPKYVAAYCNRARIHASCPDERFRDGRKAVEDATTACKLHSWKDCRSLAFLAAAYAELGEFDKAIESQKRALEVVPKVGRATFRVRLELYQAGKPYRDEPVKR